MDGLLIDTEPIWRRSEIEIFGKLGLHLTEEECLETMGVRIADVVELWYGRHPWPGLSTAQVTRRIVDKVIEHIRSEGEPKAGVLSAVVMVHEAGMRVAIASSSGLELIWAVVDRLGIRDCVDAAFSAEDDPEGKPHPAVYLRTAAGLSVRPEECVALEDSPNGVVSAKAASMLCIAVPDPYLASDPRMGLADMRLDSLDDFTPELLRRLRRNEVGQPTP
jgi:sugar-phosphatase